MVIAIEKVDLIGQLKAYRQTGSAFKPIVYLTALEEDYTPIDKIEDEPVTCNWGQSKLVTTKLHI